MSLEIEIDDGMENEAIPAKKKRATRKGRSKPVDTKAKIPSPKKGEKMVEVATVQRGSFYRKSDGQIYRKGDVFIVKDSDLSMRNFSTLLSLQTIPETFAPKLVTKKAMKRG